ncbi:SDR family oxidoreductase [Agaribacterium sp. ZY112]|uniref:SDR family oxidoreductase n=1 Tax=Agaribacterium sp. ZY112 TaxID=3233574 RepID=UPI003524011D
MVKQLSIEGKTALVLGASKGIGLACANKLAECGATVVMAARSLERLESAVQCIREQGGKAIATQCDVASYRSVESAVQSALKQTGRLDIVVNNAGVIEPLTSLAESDPQEWSRAVDVNVKGVYHGMRAALPSMLEAGSGVIVNMSSGAANSALLGWSHYCSTKAAVKKLTEVAHVELQHKNIRVVGLSPGTVATDMMAAIRDAKINVVSELDWASHIPPEWVGEAVAFLCGPEGQAYAGTDFSIKTKEGRQAVGLPFHGAA